MKAIKSILIDIMMGMDHVGYASARRVKRNFAIGIKRVLQMQTEINVEINRPIDQVFDYTLNNVTEWSSTVVEDQVIEDVNNGDIGTLFRCVTEENGQRMDFRGTVIEYDPPKRSMIHLEGQHFDIVVDYLFEDLGGRTRVTQLSEVTGKGFTKFIFQFLGWALQGSASRAVECELLNLKKILESSND